MKLIAGMIVALGFGAFVVVPLVGSNRDAKFKAAAEAALGTGLSTFSHNDNNYELRPSTKDRCILFAYNTDKGDVVRWSPTTGFDGKNSGRPRTFMNPACPAQASKG